VRGGAVREGALWLLSLLVVLFLVAPSLVVIPMSFSAAELLTFPPPGYSLRWYAEFFTRPEWRLAAWNSVVVAVLTTALATALGTVTALGLVRGRLPCRRLVTAVFLTPLIVPAIVTAVAVYGLYARLQLSGTVPGMVLAHTVLALPFVIINVSAVLQGLDPRLEQAARSLGASPWRTFRLVTLPLVRPGVAAGAVFAFITSFDELVVALFVSGIEAVTLPVQMWSGIRFEINPTVAAVSTLLIAVSGTVLVLAGAVRRRGR
jgi:putative spermidine/putrescine transport system permease protein